MQLNGLSQFLSFLNKSHPHNINRGPSFSNHNHEIHNVKKAMENRSSPATGDDLEAGFPVVV